ncbi:unnamed protein product [Caenorhabditis sp. 36 PRJEB53466]|nr:unnamed protein product [Caenorhabditis sp. 36 PRJEB53466]
MGWERNDCACSTSLNNCIENGDSASSSTARKDLPVTTIQPVIVNTEDPTTLEVSDVSQPRENNAKENEPKSSITLFSNLFIVLLVVLNAL